MKVGRLNHVGVATPSIKQSVAMYRDVLGATHIGDAFDLPAQGVRVCFVDAPNSQIELIEPLGADSPIAKFLEKNPLGGQHHVCFEVADIDAARAWFEGKGAADRGAWDADLLSPPQGHGRHADRDHGEPDAGALILYPGEGRGPGGAAAPNFV
jgi:methylmalonyl-CoA/ethylmalonyl-CoA epimerase